MPAPGAEPPALLLVAPLVASSPEPASPSGVTRVFLAVLDEHAAARATVVPSVNHAHASERVIAAWFYDLVGVAKRGGLAQLFSAARDA
jgi:hypothetical protein